jgi:uncharacterized protein (DUF1015 family)
MMMTFVNMDAPGITILPTHRVVFNLPGFNAPGFTTRAAELFEVKSLATPDSSILTNIKGVAFIAVTREGSFLLTAKPDAVKSALHQLDPHISPRQAKLDVVQLHRVVLERLLGLNQETVTKLGNIHYIREASEAIGLVTSSEADIAFLIKPITLDQLKDISLSGDVMPQKSTDFYPKLLSGLAIYALD